MADRARKTSLEGALLVRERERGVLAVRGPDRAKWLNGVVTPDVAQLAAGRGVFGLLLSKQGKIQTDLLLGAGAAEFLLAVAPGTAELALAELDRMLVMEDAEIVNRSGELECFALHGSRAFALAQAAAERRGGTAAELDRTGLGGALLFVEQAEADAIAAALVGEGASLASADAWESLRLERGVGVFGVDYGPGDNPHEAALERLAISWSKGCYLGQEAVFMQDARGKLKRRLSLLNLVGGRADSGAPVLGPAGETVGEVTSAVAAGAGGLALAKVKAPHFELGSNLSVAGAAAVVVERPV
jgi:tRNA-modifying protein YgfZ